jgi:inosine/xanthosine triphosphatase
LDKVYIASINPVKIECTRLAFTEVFGSDKYEFIGRPVSSDVSDQPVNDIETYQGAKNRAMNLRSQFPDGTFWVGIEGGIEIINNEMHAFAWMVVLTKDKHGEARTATFVLPPRIKELVEQGVELGHADDEVFNRRNSKQKDGAVGILTNGLIDRTQYYKPAIILALIPFMKKDLF